MRVRMCRRSDSNLENQRGTVNDSGAGDVLQGSNLRGRQVVVEDHHIGTGGLNRLPQLLHLALAQERVGIRCGPGLQQSPHRRAACRLQQRLQLLQGRLRSGLLL